MVQFTFEEIQSILNKVAKLHESDTNFVSAEFTLEEKIKVRYLNIKIKPSFLPLTMDLITQDGRIFKIEIIAEEGPSIIPSIGDVKNHPPILNEYGLVGEMGGDQCRNANDMGHFGTISFYVGGIQIDVNGRICNYHCGSDNALVSNNHVIARSDAGGIGEIVWTPFRADVARLACILPLSCQADFAIARFSDASNIQKWTVRTIGALNNLRNPVIGEAIKKHGARTGYTTGAILSQVVVNTGAHVYYTAFKTTPGFACQGDSGSAIVASNNDVLGIFSWVDNIPCENNPSGYFWIFDFQALSPKEDEVINLSPKVSNA